MRRNTEEEAEAGNSSRAGDGMDREAQRRNEKRIIMCSGLLSATSAAATMETSLKKKSALGVIRA